MIQLEFSHNDKYLLSVSRDLGHCVYEVVRSEGASTALKLFAKVPKAHTRISWGCSWSPDDKYLATCSRDGTVKVWTLNPSAGSAEQKLAVAWKATLDDSVTAVSFAPLPASSNRTPAPQISNVPCPL